LPVSGNNGWLTIFFVLCCCMAIVEFFQSTSCLFKGQSLFLWDWPKLSKYRESRTSEDLKMIA
jgi:hypothetical protein